MNDAAPLWHERELLAARRGLERPHGDEPGAPSSSTHAAFRVGAPAHARRNVTRDDAPDAGARGNCMERMDTAREPGDTGPARFRSSEERAGHGLLPEDTAARSRLHAALPEKPRAEPR
jgi:hypothetical protein